MRFDLVRSNVIRAFATCVILAVATIGIAACATPTAAPSAAATVAPAAAAPSQLTEVTVVMGYVPNIQFAPWYVADKNGYFTQAGIKIKYNWGLEIDGAKLVGAGQADFAMLGGDQVILARSQGIPLVYVASYYNGFPCTVVSLKDKNIKSPKDLIGKKVGLPAFWGANYTGWRALLYATGIKESDVQVQDIGFNQVPAITQGTVDAAVGYSNNEPVQLELAGKEINTINVKDYSKLVGIGLVTNEKTVADRPQLVQKMVGALIQGLDYTIKNPDQALAISVQALPEAGGANLKTSQGVLQASIDLWKNPRIGYVAPADWTESGKFMKDAGFIKTDIDVTKAYTNQFVP
jgi:NitT/TauT family transport system substrate-binding protein